MADETTEALDAKLERGERLIRVWRELSASERASGGITNTVSSVFNLGGAGLVVGFCFGAICLGFAIGLYFRLEARELVMAAERRADMAIIDAVQSDAKYAKDQAAVAKTMAQQYRIETSERLAKLENK